MTLPKIIADEELNRDGLCYSIKISREMFYEIEELKKKYQDRRAVNRWLRQLWRLGLESQRHEDR